RMTQLGGMDVSVRDSLAGLVDPPQSLSADVRKSFLPDVKILIICGGADIQPKTSRCAIESRANVHQLLAVQKVSRDLQGGTRGEFLEIIHDLRNKDVVFAL